MRIAALLITLAILTGCPAEPPGGEPTPTPGPTPTPATTPTPTPTPMPTLSLLTDDPLPACSPSAAGFDDGTPASGVVFSVDPNGQVEPPTDPELEVFFDDIAAGVVLADLDDDGALDLYLPQIVGPNALYWGRGDGTFEEGAPGPDAARTDQLDASASTADFDGDGDLDLVVSGTGTLALLRNEGDRTFEDVTAAFGIAPRHGSPGTTAWADFDGDGDLDLYVGTNQGDGSYPAPESLWRNDGGTFTDLLAGRLAIDDLPSLGLHAIASDLDGDGDADLLAVHDGGPVFTPTRFWENAGTDDAGDPVWLDRTADTGTAGIDFGMGAALADLDGDGQDDLVTSDIGAMGVFRRDGPWSWIDVRASWTPGLPEEKTDVSWSVVPLDLDGDGRPGLLITYGSLGFPDVVPDVEHADYFLRGDGEGSEFTMSRSPDVFPSPPTESSRGVGVGDINGDGTPDVVIGRIRAATSILTTRCTDSARLVVDLRDDGSDNRFAVGARVSVQGDRSTSADVRAGGIGTFSGSGPTLYFGLGGASETETLTVRWPDGVEETFTDVCANCRVRIDRVRP
jgi:enediyne biosynthesis protein E4